MKNSDLCILSQLISKSAYRRRQNNLKSNTGETDEMAPSISEKGTVILFHIRFNGNDETDIDLSDRPLGRESTTCVDKIAAGIGSRRKMSRDSVKASLIKLIDSLKFQTTNF